jgi:E3 ubiquitin-protein ligase BRE1
VTANHTTLLANNAWLLKQITEKNEMNAKSLSTILYLKSTTEKLVEERDHLGLQMKNASRLALAARLATNTKERVSEELLKEKDNLDTCRIALDGQLLSSQL